MKKKTSALFAALVLVLVGTIGGTMAWLTAESGEVVNTFTTSGIDITLAETTGKNYKMVPGYTINKNPTVTVKAGSEKCYLFVKLEKSANFSDFLTYGMADGWGTLPDVSDVYYRVVDASSADQSFGVLKNDQVVVSGDVTKEMMDSLGKGTYPTLTVTAYASQYMKDNDNSFAPAEAWVNISGSAGN